MRQQVTRRDVARRDSVLAVARAQAVRSGGSKFRPIHSSTRSSAQTMSHKEPSLGACCAAELLGTFVLIFFGCGAVHVAVVLGGLSGTWQVATVWGFGVAIAVYAFGSVGGAHINPAVTIASMCFGGFDASRVLPYIAAQLAGAFLAAFVLHVIFSGSIAAYEEIHRIERGAPGSEVTASMYGEYFPNPAVEFHGAGAAARLENLSTASAAFAEIVGTAILVFVVFALTDARNHGGPGEKLAPFFIGMTVASIIVVIGPLTQSCLNPARDFGPRLFASLAGWGPFAWTGQTGLASILAVYLAAPIIGGVLGAGLWTNVVARWRAE